MHLKDSISSPVAAMAVGAAPPADPAFCTPDSVPLFTDYWWAKEEAAKAGNLDKILEDWRRRRKNVSKHEWNPVLRAFQSSRQTLLYQLDVDDVWRVAKSTEHALGEVKAAEARRPENLFAANLSPTYAVVMLLHDLMEALGRVPSWSDVERYLFDHQEVCLRYFLDAGGIPPLDCISSMWAHPKMRAVRWRMANFYYSFLKEIHIIVSLRRIYGLDARYHPLLDTEWKADFVCGPVRGELFYTNDTYKAATSGRKTPCQIRNPGLPVVTMLVDEPDGFGRCWLYKDNIIAKLAQEIRRHGGTSVPSFIFPG